MNLKIAKVIALLRDGVQRFFGEKYLTMAEVATDDRVILRSGECMNKHGRKIEVISIRSSIKYKVKIVKSEVEKLFISTQLWRYSGFKMMIWTSPQVNLIILTLKAQVQKKILILKLLYLTQRTKTMWRMPNLNIAGW